MHDKIRNESDSQLNHYEDSIRYRALVESMNDGFGIIDDKGIFTYVNPRFAGMLDYTEEQMVGRSITEFLDDNNKKILRDAIRQRAKGQATQYELEWSKNSGGSVSTIVSGAPILDENGIHRGSFAVVTDVTELKRSREALSENAEMMKRIFEESQVGIELFDANGILIDANQAALRMAGISSLQELVGFSLFDDPNVPVEIKTELIRGHPVKYEVVFDFNKVKERNLYKTSRSGTIVLDAWITPLTSKNSKALKGYLSQITEKTEHRATQAALVDSQKQYQLLAENVTDVIFTTDLELNLTYVSPSVKLLTGYAAEELIGRSMIEIMTPDSVWTAIEAMKDALEDEMSEEKLSRGESAPIELKLKKTDGSAIWVETTRTFLRDEHGKPTGVLGVVRNIEERKQAEEALVDSELKYRTLVEQSFQGIAIIRPLPLGVKFANSAFAAFLGFSVDEILVLTPKQIEDIVHPDDWHFLMKRLKELMSGEPPAIDPVVMRAFRKDGNMQYLEVFGKQVEFEGSLALQLIAINVTERLSAEKHIQTQKQRASMYLDLMSHDFRNQLQIILGSSMVLEEKLENPNDRRLLGQIVSAVERCQSMISKVNITEPLMSVPLHPRRLDDAVEEVIELHQKRYQDAEIELMLKNRNAIVDADEFLEQLLTNLIENAIEHNPNMERKVWIKLVRAGEGYEIVISDNGDGISESFKMAIFDASRRYGGVGLLQAKQICDKYGGRIEVRDRIEGQPDKGAEFLVWLPRTKVQDNSLQ